MHQPQPSGNGKEPELLMLSPQQCLQIIEELTSTMRRKLEEKASLDPKMQPLMMDLAMKAQLLVYVTHVTLAQSIETHGTNPKIEQCPNFPELYKGILPSKN
jgi:hypothetical protein